MGAIGEGPGVSGEKWSGGGFVGLAVKVARAVLPYGRDGRRGSVWSWDARGLFFVLLGGPVMIGNAVAPGVRWVWWQRALFGLGGVAFAVVAVLALVGGWVLLSREGRAAAGHPERPA
ncbi:hypothetical protein GCM10017688_26830 [Streptomyces ramulosus]